MKKLVLILLLPLLFSCANDYTNSFEEYLLDSSNGQSVEVADFLNNQIPDDLEGNDVLILDFSDANFEKGKNEVEGRAIMYFENSILKDLEFDEFKYNQFEFQGFDHALTISDGKIYGFD